MDRISKKTEASRVGIITISRQFVLSNYGTFFQHWSLRRTLRLFGYNPYRVSDNEESSSTILWIIMRTIKRLLVMPYRCWNRKISFLGECKSLYFTLCQNIKFYYEYRRRVGVFFENYKVADIYAVVVGSDQVWTSSGEREFACKFFDGCKKISYAASADWLRVRDSSLWKDRIREELPKYKGVSVREKLGVNVINDLMHTNLSIFHAIDPVFLTCREEYFRKFCDSNLETEPIMLYYVVNINSYEELNYTELLKVAKLLHVKLKVVGLQGAERLLPFSVQTIVSPSKFLKLYCQAKYVVTNSFHGTVFALIFCKQFACIEQVERKGASQNVRCTELLDELCLAGQKLKSTFSSNELMLCLKQKIDYTHVCEKIELWRSNSIQWLKKCLETCSV